MTLTPPVRFTFHLSRFTLFASLFTGFLWACEGALPPLRGKVEIGQEPYAVFVGGNALNSDLYAVSASGGPASPLTYTPVAELSPALAPDGGSVVFLRAKSLRDSTPATVWILNLVNGADRELRLPKGAGLPRRVGWEPNGRAIVIETQKGLYWMDPPPAKVIAQPVPQAAYARAESSLTVLLGDPVFARVVPCTTPDELCVVGDTGTPGLLVRGGRDPFRWGTDSVAFLLGNRLEIRPLGPGRARRLTWTNLPENPRQLTFFPGKRN
jgi:hypothetical protein